MSHFRIIGSSGSPYSIKVRSYLRYKRLEHVWLVRNTAEVIEEHATHAKLPLVPTVIELDSAGGIIRVLQDSTPIIETLEAESPQPSILPTDSTLRFVAALIEEFADEWANKWMMHYRWYSAMSDEDAQKYARRIAVEMKSGQAAAVGDKELLEEVGELAGAFRERMLGRAFTVGSNNTTAPIIEESFTDTLMMLEAHMKSRDFLLGGRPSIADFGLAGQLGQMLNDVTAGELLRLYAPNVVLWLERMLNPSSTGEWEDLEGLMPTLQPILKKQVSTFLRWANAVSEALRAGEKKLVLELDRGKRWEQEIGGPQRLKHRHVMLVF